MTNTTKELTIEDLFNYRRKGAGGLVDAYEQLQQRNAELEKQNANLKEQYNKNVNHPDDEAVHAFACQMKGKLAIARAKGRGGWENPELCPAERLAEMLIGHLSKGNSGNYLDVANFCMMLHQRGENESALSKCLSKNYARVARKAILELIESETSVGRLHNGEKRSFIFAQDAARFARNYGVKDGE